MSRGKLLWIYLLANCASSITVDQKLTTPNQLKSFETWFTSKKEFSSNLVAFFMATNVGRVSTVLQQLPSVSISSLVKILEASILPFPA
jgi:hypothetical protein